VDVASLKKARLFIMYPFLFGALMFVSSFWSPVTSYGLEKTLVYFVFSIGLAAVLLTQLRTMEDIRGLMIFVFMFSLITAFWGVVENRTAFDSWREMQFYGGSSDPENSLVELAIAYGRRSGLGLLTAIALMPLVKQKLYRCLLVAAILFLLIILVKSGSRGALVGTVVGIFSYFFLTARGKWGKNLMFVFLLMAGIYLIIDLSSGLLEYRYQQDNFERSKDFRLSMYIHGFTVFLDYPLAGVGAGGWGSLYFGSGSRMYPHNIFSEIGAEMGILGLWFFCMFLWKTFSKWLRLKRILRSDNQASAILHWAFSFLLSGLAYAQFSGHVSRNEWIWISSAIIFAIYNIVSDRYCPSTNQPSSNMGFYKVKEVQR